MAGVLLRQRRARPTRRCTGVLAFTRGDRYQAAARLSGDGESLSTRISASDCAQLGQPRYAAAGLRRARGAGINIVGPTSTRPRTRAATNRRLGGARRPRSRAARRHSDSKFLIMPAEESRRQPAGRPLGISCSRSPVYWTSGARPEQPFVEDHPDYGKLYRDRRRRRHDGDGPAREHADLHAASAHEGVDRAIPTPSRTRRTSAIANYRGVGMAMGHGAGSVGAAPVRCARADAVRRHEQLGRRYAGAARSIIERRSTGRPYRDKVPGDDIYAQ